MKLRKKSMLLSILVFLFVASGSAFCEANMGIGLTGGIQPFEGLEGYLCATAVLPSTPVVLGVGAQFYNIPIRVNMSIFLDWLMVRHPFLDNLIIYSGPGVYASFPDPFELGVRIPVGLSWFVADKQVELFLETAPVMVFAGDDSVLIPGFKLISLVGVRFWF